MAPVTPPHRARRARWARLGAAATVVLGLVVGCSGGEGSEVGAPTSAEPTSLPTSEPASEPAVTESSDPSPPSSTTVPTTVLPPLDAQPLELRGEEQVNPGFRQGVARVADGWILTSNNQLYRTDEAFSPVVVRDPAIPDDLAQRGFDHLGDPDVADGIVYGPLEQPDYGKGVQAMARYDSATLELLGVTEVAQAHAAWVSVADGVAYSMDGFSDDSVLRYDLDDGWEPLPPLPLDRWVHRVQGGDVADGVLWLSTDDDVDGIYRVDLSTGAVVRVGESGRALGEGEGIDVAEVGAGRVHVLTLDPDAFMVWFQHFG